MVIQRLRCPRYGLGVSAVAGLAGPLVWHPNVWGGVLFQLYEALTGPLGTWWHLHTPYPLVR